MSNQFIMGIVELHSVDIADAMRPSLVYNDCLADNGTVE